LLDLVEAGEEVVVARRGRAVTRLFHHPVPLSIPIRARHAAAAIRAMSRRVKLETFSRDSCVAKDSYNIK